MLIGDLISRFEDETTATEAVLDLNDLRLVASVANAADEASVTVGEFVASMVRHFITHASDAEWLTLFGKLSGSQDPGRAFLHHILTAATASHDGHSHGKEGREFKAATPL